MESASIFVLMIILMAIQLVTVLHNHESAAELMGRIRGDSFISLIMIFLYQQGKRKRRLFS